MDFLGSNLPLNSLELAGFQIDPAHREDLPDLMRTRWFEYRMLHPVTATYLYAQKYKDQVKTFAESYVDIETADEAKAFTPDDIFKSRDRTSMWLARGAADRVGCPYEVALDFAQHRALDRTFQRFPRPNQLYGEDFELDLTDHWKQMCNYSLQYCRGTHFAASRWTPRDAPPEVAQHMTFLAQQILDRGAPRHNLIARMVREDRLSPLWPLPFEKADIDAAVRQVTN